MSILKLKEVASILRVSPQTVGILIRDKKLRAMKIGGQNRIDTADLAKFMRENYNLPFERPAETPAATPAATPVKVEAPAATPESAKAPAKAESEAA